MGLPHLEGPMGRNPFHEQDRHEHADMVEDLLRWAVVVCSFVYLTTVGEIVSFLLSFD